LLLQSIGGFSVNAPPRQEIPSYSEAFPRTESSSFREKDDLDDVPSPRPLEPAEERLQREIPSSKPDSQPAFSESADTVDVRKKPTLASRMWLWLPALLLPAVFAYGAWHLGGTTFWGWSAFIAAIL